MLIHTLAAAAATAAPQNKFGFAEALFPGGRPASSRYTTVTILADHVGRFVLHPVHQVASSRTRS